MAGDSSCPLIGCAHEKKLLQRSQKPVFIEPMLASPVRELPGGAAWSYEAKLAGHRCLAAKRFSGVTLRSRRDNGFTNAVPGCRQCYAQSCRQTR